jgi:hypothetical protein
LTDRHHSVACNGYVLDVVIFALISRLTIAFALLAALLAAVGLYGVLSQAVAERRPEFGVRAALGAAPRDIRPNGRLGRPPAASRRDRRRGGPTFWLVRFIEGRLFGVQPLDPISYAGAIAGVLIVALVAAFVPAKRTAGVEPVISLRD